MGTTKKIKQSWFTIKKKIAIFAVFVIFFVAIFTLQNLQNQAPPQIHEEPCFGIKINGQCGIGFGFRLDQIFIYNFATYQWKVYDQQIDSQVLCTKVSENVSRCVPEIQSMMEGTAFVNFNIGNDSQQCEWKMTARPYNDSVIKMFNLGERNFTTFMATAYGNKINTTLGWVTFIYDIHPELCMRPTCNTCDFFFILPDGSALHA